MSAVMEKEGLSISYGVTDTAISVLRERYSGITKIETTEDYETVRVGIGKVRELRVSVEKKRVELKADALEFGRKVDKEAKRITEMLEGIEVPLKKLKADVDEAKERERRKKEEEERAAIEAELKAKRDAQEAAEREQRERIAKEQAEEAARLSAEREELAKQRREMEEKARIEREKIEAEQNAERERMAEERRKIVAEQQRLERLEFERVAKENAERLAAEKLAKAKLEEERLAKAEAARIKRVEAAKPDVAKVHAFAETLAALPFPKVKSQEASQALDNASTHIQRAVEFLRAFSVS